MTICAGFNCSDGIVICADTEESTEHFKRTVPKLEVRPAVPKKSDTCRIVFTGSGEASFVDSLIENLWKAVPQDQSATLDDIVVKLDSKLTAHYRKIWSIYPKQTARELLPFADLLFAVWCKGGCGLYLARGYDMTSVSRYVSIGYGQELASYICDPIFEPALVAEMIILIAAFMLRETKIHVPYCGGDSHVVILKKDGAIAQLQPLDVHSLGDQMATWVTAMKHMPFAYANEKITDAQFTEVFNLVAKNLIVQRQKFVQNRREFWQSVNTAMQGILSEATEVLKRSVSRNSTDRR